MVSQQEKDYKVELKQKKAKWWWRKHRKRLKDGDTAEKILNNGETRKNVQYRWREQKKA